MLISLFSFYEKTWKDDNNMSNDKTLQEAMKRAKQDFVEPKGYIALIDLGDKSLNGNPTQVFSAIYNRLGLSVQNGEDFFDRKENRYYVVYTYSDLAELINQSTKTISRIMDKLVEAGLIFRKKCFNGTYKLFPSLPDAVKEKFLGHSKKDVATDAPQQVESADTIPADKKSSSNKTNSLLNYLNFNHLKLRSNNTNNSKINENIDNVEIAAEESTLLSYGMPQNLIDTLVSLSYGSAKKLTNYAKLIMNAKKKVYRDLNYRKEPLARTATMFESNEFIKDRINREVSRIILYVGKKYHDQESMDKVMFTSFKNFFQECFDLLKMYGSIENQTSLVC